MLLSKIHRHPRDEKIVFHEEGHIYDIEGMEGHPISVTTLIHKFFPEFNADLVIDKMMKSRNWKTSKYFGKTKQQIKDEWETSGTEASSLGTAMHADIERFLNKESPLKVTKEFTYFLQFWEDFQREHPGFVPYRTEWLVYDEDKKLAGSIDCVLTNEDGDIIILDWKRSKEIKMTNSFEKGLGPMSNFDNCNYWHYTMQLNMYRHVLETRYGRRVVGMHIVVFHPNNPSYQTFELNKLPIETIWDRLFV